MDMNLINSPRPRIFEYFCPHFSIDRCLSLMVDGSYEDANRGALVKHVRPCAFSYL